MNLIENKLTMYDTLTMMVSGFLILTFFFGITEHTILFFIGCYVVGMVYHKFIEGVTGKWLRNNVSMIRREYENVVSKHKDLEHSELDENKIKSVYYEAYYYLMKHQTLGNIPVLEAQEAFLKNMSTLSVFYLILSLFGCVGNVICFCCICVIILILSLVWYLIQRKIYHLVWEGYIFIRHINKMSE